MQINLRELSGKGTFYVEENGNTLAELVYTIPSAHTIIIEHTEVNESLGGRGVGKELVKAAVDHARAKNIKIIPICPFAKSVLEREPEWRDVL